MIQAFPAVSQRSISHMGANGKFSDFMLVFSHQSVDILAFNSIRKSNKSLSDATAYYALL